MVPGHIGRVAPGVVVPELLSIDARPRARLSRLPGKELIAFGHEACVGMPWAVPNGLRERRRERQRVEARTEVGSMEVRRREPGLGGHYAMCGGDHVVPTDLLEHLAEVYHEGSRHDGYVDPVAGGIESLQTTDLVLRENRDEAGIVVGVDAALAGRRRGVANEFGERHRPFSKDVLEMILPEPEGRRQRGHQLIGDRTQSPR